MTKILERSRSTIVQVGEDGIELVELEQEAPLLLDKQIIDIINSNLEHWYWHRQISMAFKSRKRKIETISAVPEMATLFTLPIEDGDGLQQGIVQKEQDSVADMLMLRENMNELRLEMEHAKVMDDPVKRLKMEALLQRVEDAIEFDRNLTEKKNVVNESCCVADVDGDSDTKENKAIELDEKMAYKTNPTLTSDANTVKQSYYTRTRIDGDNIEKHKADINKDKPYPLSEPTTQHMIIDVIRRTSVAITGGSLTVAGVACIPCPIVPGCLIVYVGLMILATEFESARIALDAVKMPLDRWLLAAHDDDEEGVSVGLLPEVSILK